LTHEGLILGPAPHPHLHPYPYVQVCLEKITGQAAFLSCLCFDCLHSLTAFPLSVGWLRMLSPVSGYLWLSAARKAAFQPPAERSSFANCLHYNIVFLIIQVLECRSLIQSPFSTLNGHCIPQVRQV